MVYKATEIMDPSKYLWIFKKKFENVLNKVPIIANLKLVGTKATVYIQVTSTEEVEVDYLVDLSIDVKQNVFNLRKLMEEHFPVFTVKRVITRKLSSTEANELVNKGEATLDEALGKTYDTVLKNNYKIVRVVDVRDELFIKDLSTGEQTRHKLHHYPVITFLKNIREGKLTLEEAGDLFEEKSRFIDKIYSEKEFNKIKNK